MKFYKQLSTYDPVILSKKMCVKNGSNDHIILRWFSGIMAKYICHGVPRTLVANYRAFKYTYGTGGKLIYEEI